MERIINRIRIIRGKSLNDSNSGSGMRVEGTIAYQIHDLFEMACKRSGMNQEEMTQSIACSNAPTIGQLSLYEWHDSHNSQHFSPEAV